MTADTLFDAYLDANIVLAIAAVFWALTRLVLRRTDLRYAFSTHLNLLYGAFVTLASVPVIVFAFGFAVRQGWIGQDYAVSFSDIAVAQFLDGRIDMAPSQFETLLAVRSQFVLDVTTLGSTFGVVVAGALIAGVILVAFRTVRNAYQVARLVQRGFVWRTFGRVQIRLTDQTHVPFSTRGIFRHYIVLPSGLLSEADDLRIAVAHEIQHIRQQDLLWEVTLEALRPFFFWNPAFLFLKRDVERLRELACDQAVLERRWFSVREYCECLLRVCQRSLAHGGTPQMLVPSVPFAQVDGGLSGGASARFLKFRVLSMTTNSGRRPNRWFGAGVMMSLAFAIAFGAIASQQAQDWSQDRLMLSTIVNLERLNALNGAGR